MSDQGRFLREQLPAAAEITFPALDVKVGRLDMPLRRMLPGGEAALSRYPVIPANMKSAAHGLVLAGGMLLPSVIQI
jgi:hypothetical protein